MKVKSLGQVQSDRLYFVGEELELSEEDARSLLALVPPPIEILEEVVVIPEPSELEDKPAEELDSSDKPPLPEKQKKR